MRQEAYIRIGVVAAGIVVGLVLAACSETEEAALQLAPTEERLRQRADAAFAELSAGHLMAYYEYLSPSLRKARWPYGLELVQRCSPDKFLFQMESQMSELLGMVGAEGDVLPSWRVTGVTIVRVFGFVNIEVSYKGEPVGLTRIRQSETWAFLDGDWWLENKDWHDRCPSLIVSQEEEAEGVTTN